MSRLLVGLLLIMCSDTFVIAQVARPKSFHVENGWKAEVYFDDVKVISLCRAIEANDLAEMERLIKNGVDVNAKGRANVTPLLWAFPDEKMERFELLLKYGADPNVTIAGRPTLNGFSAGDSVTERAALLKSPQQFDLVMKYGGNAKLICPGSNVSLAATLLGSPASSAEKIRRLDLLFEKGADVNDMSAGASLAYFALDTFVDREVALHLLEKGTDPNLRTVMNRKIIHLLVQPKPPSDNFKINQMNAKLLKWLTDHGQSVEEAKKDWKRWESWESLAPTDRTRLLKAEVAETRAREAAEKAKKDGAGGEKRP